MPRGGYRPGAGRKSNAELQAVRTVLDQSISSKDWHSLMRRLHQLAMKGNMRAAQLLIAYRYGDPHAPPPEPDGERRVVVQIIHDDDPPPEHLDLSDIPRNLPPNLP